MEDADNDGNEDLDGWTPDAANGDLVGIYFDPTGDDDLNDDHDQPMLIGYGLFDECIC